MEQDDQSLADDLLGSDENERRKVVELRELVKRHDPAAKEVDNATLRRFLRARDQDVKKASQFLSKHLEWRRSAVPNGFISEAEIKNELSQRKVFVQGFDKIGRPIGVVLNARHDPSKRNLAEFKRFVVYIIDTLCARAGEGQDKFTVIGDFKDWGFSNLDIRSYLAALDIFQNNYPERLGKAIIVHAPYLFLKTWKIIYPLIDKNTREKFVFLKDENMTENLLEYIDESQLPEIFGGKLPLVPIEESSGLV
ncbi:uncharacterized protein [Typha latifolia]|uniref:uncharacterized protein isoform X1 n=1 Tax=Typha latifolia TaxID=4733 RepID=UPI003C2FA46B